MTMLDVETLDSGLAKPGFAASFLLRLSSGDAHGKVQAQRYALVDVGASSNGTFLTEALQQRGVDFNCVEFIFVTHVHLDHAGGAGLLLRDYFPRARVVVHELGARHLAQPQRLEAGARAVYGDELYDILFSHVVPVDAERMVIVKEGDFLDFANGRILDTPGHARHHYCLYFDAVGAVFTGDTFGLSYPSLATPRGPFLYPTTTPTSLEPERLLASIARLAILEPRVAYLTHFGPLENPATHAADLSRRLRDMCAVAERTGASAEALCELFQQEYAAHGGDVVMAQDWMVTDLDLNARGLAHWLSLRGQRHG